MQSVSVVAQLINGKAVNALPTLLTYCSFGQERWQSNDSKSIYLKLILNKALIFAAAILYRCNVSWLQPTEKTETLDNKEIDYW
jgi:hypothetical protein